MTPVPPRWYVRSGPKEYEVRTDISLEFIIDGRTAFTSAGKWLHPLFELEEYLGARGIDGSSGEVHDRIVGRASAFLITRLGIRRCTPDC